MSSRNRYLDPAQRGRGLCLHRALARGRALLEAGQRRSGDIEAAMREALGPADSVDYAALRVLPDLSGTDLVPDGPLVLAVAARVGPARLIDNLALRVGPRAVTEIRLLGHGAPAGA